MSDFSRILEIIQKHKTSIIKLWVEDVILNVSSSRDIEEKDCIEMLENIIDCLQHKPAKIPSSDEYSALKKTILAFTSYRALNDYTPSETANYILRLKNVVYGVLLKELPNVDATVLLDFNKFIDEIAVLTFQNFCDSREETILSQAYALEHDTPIVEITNKIMLMPLMGIIDTIRAQKIIERLLNSVVENQTSIAILDMTAVPTFDTHVANNILKTIMAAKMVGTRVIISGISPAAALTIVKLGIDLNHVETFSTLENAMTFAYKRTGLFLTEGS